MNAKRVFLLVLWILGLSSVMAAMERDQDLVQTILPEIKAQSIVFLSKYLCAVAIHDTDRSSSIHFYDLKMFHKKSKNGSTGLLSPLLCAACAGSITALSRLDNGKKIAAAANNKILIFDTNTGQKTNSFDARSAAINSIHSHDHYPNLIISGTQDHSIKIWDLKRSVCDNLPSAHEGSITSVRISNQDRNFASASDDKTVKTWDWHMQRSIHQIKDREAAHVIEYNQHGNELMICASTVKRYDAQSNVLLSELIWNNGTIQETTAGSKISRPNCVITAYAVTGKGKDEQRALGRDDGSLGVICSDAQLKKGISLEPHIRPCQNGLDLLAFSPTQKWLIAGSCSEPGLHICRLNGKDQVKRGCFGLE